jgi:putative addiction module killer protein
VKGAVLARLKRLETGLMGDTKSLENGLFEARIHVGAGWRIYFTERSGKIILLLAGGSKKTQSGDIKRARKLAADIE